MSFVKSSEMKIPPAPEFGKVSFWARDASIAEQTKAAALADLALPNSAEEKTAEKESERSKKKYSLSVWPGNAFPLTNIKPASSSVSSKCHGEKTQPALVCTAREPLSKSRVPPLAFENSSGDRPVFR